MAIRPLTPLEARVLGVLVEKQATVPDTYPLSLNALLAGCNQKTARDPVIAATEAELLTAVDGLKSLSLVFEGSSSRVARYEHNLPRVLALTPPAAALLATLLLRGAQTAAELRQHAERLQRFADIAEVEALLAELAEREPPRVARLPRAPGAREQRWVHLLCGEPPPSTVADAADAVAPAAAAGAVAAGELAALKAQQTRLAAELAQLRAWAQQVAAALDIAPPAAP